MKEIDKKKKKRRKTATVITVVIKEQTRHFNEGIKMCLKRKNSDKKKGNY